MSRINEAALALTLALVYGTIMFIIGMAVPATGYGRKVMHLYSDLLPGYEPTARGSLIGALWGSLIGGAMGLIIGAVYNLLADRLS